MPGRSALTVTPWTAVTDPMAFQVAGQFSDFATTVVTASGGIWNAACAFMPAWICRVLTAAIAAMKTRAAITIRNIRFFIRETLQLLSRAVPSSPGVATCGLGWGFVEPGARGP